MCTTIVINNILLSDFMQLFKSWYWWFRIWKQWSMQINGIVSNTKDGFSQQKRFDLFAPKPFLRLKRWKMCCWRNHAPRIFYLYSTTYDIIFFFLSFDKMPQMYKWSNEHDLVVKHKRHATSNNLVGFLIFRKTRHCSLTYVSL